MTVYTLVSYKNDYHYDRYSDHYPSDWDIKVFENLHDIVDAIFDIKIKVSDAIGSNGNDDNWEYKVLIDGRRDDDWTDEQECEDPRFWEIEKQARELFEFWMKQADARKEAARLAEEEKKRKIDAANATARVRDEKKLLKSLQEKYPNG